MSHKKDAGLICVKLPSDLVNSNTMFNRVVPATVGGGGNLCIIMVANSPRTPTKVFWRHTSFYARYIAHIISLKGEKYYFWLSVVSPRNYIKILSRNLAEMDIQ